MSECCSPTSVYTDHPPSSVLGTPLMGACTENISSVSASDPLCFCDQVLHVWIYEKRTIMADSLVGDVEVPLNPLTEEDFMDHWLPLRTPSHHHGPNHRGTTWYATLITSCQQSSFRPVAWRHPHGEV